MDPMLGTIVATLAVISLAAVSMQALAYTRTHHK